MKLEKSPMLVLCALLAIVCGCGTKEPEVGQDTVDIVAKPNASQDTTAATTEPDADQDTVNVESGPDVGEEVTGVENDTLEDFTNSLGMKLKLIPAGEFMMGSPEDEVDRDGDEMQHRVRITEPYYLGVTEVTQGQWAEVLGIRPWEGVNLGKSGSEHAVSWVSWDHAMAFCRKLSEKEGRTYRLPTEAEWEYACRAGSRTRYCHGDDDSDLGLCAWYRENAYDVGEKYTHQVGLKRVNAWGLHDMHGNVWEWCQDWYDDDYYESSPANNPRGPSFGSYRASRGGGWGSSPRRCRSAERNGGTRDICNDYTGFRVALTPAR